MFGVKKQFSGINYPNLCLRVFDDDINEDEEEDPNLLKDRCKQKNFRLRKTNICWDLCPQKKWLNLYRNIFTMRNLPATTNPSHHQGEPVYMDAADVAELLGTQKAKKKKQWC